MTTKIAPTLQAVVEAGLRVIKVASPAEERIARRELRALLAVARAARRLITTARMLPAGAALVEIKPDSDELDGALLRLENASGASHGSRRGAKP